MSLLPWRFTIEFDVAVLCLDYVFFMFEFIDPFKLLRMKEKGKLV